jgi:hypothetical protein
MSFMFRAFSKSRRKKNKDRHSSSSAGNIAISKSHSSEDSELSSSFDRYNDNKHKRPQRVLVGSQTDEDDDDRTHPLNEQSPSHCSNASSTPSPPLEDRKALHKSHPSGPSAPLPASTSTYSDPSKRHLFQSLRRKSSPKNIQQATLIQTP